MTPVTKFLQKSETLHKVKLEKESLSIYSCCIVACSVTCAKMIWCPQKKTTVAICNEH